MVSDAGFQPAQVAGTGYRCAKTSARELMVSDAG
jgi:hypothetical protein